MTQVGLRDGHSSQQRKKVRGWIGVLKLFVYHHHFFLPTGSTSALLDLSGLDMVVTGPSYPALPTLSGGTGVPVPDQASSISLLDDELMSLGEGRGTESVWPSTH